jgi:hypothetical protein
MNKRGVGVLLFVSLVILSSYIVSAATAVEQLKVAGESVFQIIKPIVELILGTTPGGELLFAKFLFFIIMVSIVWAVLSRVDFFSGNSWVLFLVTASVSVLAVRWLSTSAIINTIILPYSTLGVAITAGFPFVLYFILVEVGFKDQPSFFRRVAWIFFGVIFIGLYIFRADTLGGETTSLIYPVTAVLAILMALIDGTIHSLLVKMELERLGKQSGTEASIELQRKMGEINNLVAQGMMTTQQANKLKKNLQRRITFLQK